ncbi:MAG: V-type ATPase subunit [Coriobacteriia bacterium]|nr:V-type ATPase subunit [Coriobacteriia bacterium]
MTRLRVIADPLRYGFAVGRVRALESGLLTATTYERLMDARDFDLQRRVLADTVYGPYLEDVQNPDDIEGALNDSFVDLYEDFLEHANLPEPMVSYFRTRHDFENLKAKLKAEALHIPAEPLMTPLGSVPVEAFSGPSERLPSSVRAAEARIRAALADEDGNLPADAVEAAVDREMFAHLSKIAAASRSEFVQHLAALEADAGNTRAFVRCRTRGVPVAVLETALVPGGAIAPSKFVELYRLSFAEGVAQLATLAPLRGIDPEALADPARLDVAIDALVAREARNRRLTSIGPDPVVSYVLSRRAELTALRTIIIGTFAHVPVERLRERVRDVA